MSRLALALAALLMLTGCGPSAQERCDALGGTRLLDKTNTGVGPAIGGKGGVAVTVSTTYYCLDAEGRILEVY